MARRISNNMLCSIGTSQDVHAGAYRHVAVELQEVSLGSGVEHIKFGRRIAGKKVQNKMGSVSHFHGRNRESCLW